MAVVIEDIEVSEGPPPQAPQAPSAPQAAAGAEIDEHQLASKLARLQWAQQRLHAD
jgi:hypothetical protein